MISLRRGRQFRLAQVVLARQAIVVPNVVCYIREGKRDEGFRSPHYLRHFVSQQRQRRLQLIRSVGVFLFGGGAAAPVARLRPARRRPRFSVEKVVHADALFGVADRFQSFPDQKSFLDPNPARTPLKVPPPCLPPPAGVGQPGCKPGT